MSGHEIFNGMCSNGVQQTCYKFAICNRGPDHDYKRALFEICTSSVYVRGNCCDKPDLLLLRFLSRGIYANILRNIIIRISFCMVVSTFNHGKCSCWRSDQWRYSYTAGIRFMGITTFKFKLKSQTSVYIDPSCFRTCAVLSPIFHSIESLSNTSTPYVPLPSHGTAEQNRVEQSSVDKSLV